MNIVELSNTAVSSVRALGIVETEYIYVYICMVRSSQVYGKFFLFQHSDLMESLEDLPKVYIYHYLHLPKVKAIQFVGKV